MLRVRMNGWEEMREEKKFEVWGLDPMIDA
jgi:hypothetical protein